MGVDECRLPTCLNPRACCRHSTADRDHLFRVCQLSWGTRVRRREGCHGALMCPFTALRLAHEEHISQGSGQHLGFWGGALKGAWERTEVEGAA